MRLKLERYHRDIRRQDHEALFRMRRQQMLQAEEEEEAEIIVRRGRAARQEVEMNGEIHEHLQNQADIYQQWIVDQAAMRRHTDQGSYGAVLNIIRSIRETLKEIRNPNRQNRFNKAQMYETLLRSGILSEAIRAARKAERQECSSGTLQALAVNSLYIFEHLLAEQALQFKEQLFLQSDILPFLRLCASQAPYDKKHISRLIRVAIHMIHTSAELSGQLLRLMFTPASVFGVGAIIYCISRNQIEPKQEVTINFLIFMKTCAQKADDALYKAKQYKNKEFELPTFLSGAESDLVFEVALRSAHYFLHHLQQQQANLSLDQSLEVLQYLVQQANWKSKWLRRIDLKGFVNLLREKDCPTEVSLKILLIIDHLIYLDNSDADFTFQLVRGCELLQVIWRIKDAHLMVISNIICNIATMQTFHEDMTPYLNNYFLAFGYQNEYLKLHLLYNWLFAKQFCLRNSQDMLMLKLVEQSKSQRESKDEKLQALESLLWLSLIDNNEIKVPAYVLEYDNPSSQKIREILSDNRGINPL